MFRSKPEECWKWYLMRFLICREAEPNDGHRAIVDAEEILGDRFSLVTQNIDGLHLRAGSSFDNCYQIHGSINHMRCASACCPDLFPLPEECNVINETEEFESVRDLLKCPKCGGMSRPHVLWFDEYYTELYRITEAQQRMIEAEKIIFMGTSFSVNITQMALQAAVTQGIPVEIVDPNPVEIPYDKTTYHRMKASEFIKLAD